MSQEFRHIVRVIGTDLEGSETLEYGLKRLKGVNINLSKALLKRANLSADLKIGNLTSSDVQKLEDVLKNPQKYGIPGWLLNRSKDPETGKDLHLLGPDLTLSLKPDISKMVQIRSWKGIRHSLGLKVRGQRTKTCGRTGRAVGVKRRRAVTS